jgi:hypothetical protein
MSWILLAYIIYKQLLTSIVSTYKAHLQLFWGEGWYTVQMFKKLISSIVYLLHVEYILTLIVIWYSHIFM